METDAERIDREVVQRILRQWPNADVASYLASVGYPKDVVRETFRAEFQRKCKPVSATCSGERK